MKTYYISWYGPYCMDNIYENDFGDNEKLYSNVLYMIAGKERYQRGPDEVKYISTDSTSSRSFLFTSVLSKHPIQT